MTATNFDEIIERRGTGCNKWDRQDPKRGKPKEPALAFTIADMDYAVPPCILESMKKRVEHPIYGYSFPEPNLYAAVMGWMERRHNVRLEKSWIKLTEGIITALAMVLETITDIGEKVMVFTPVYNPFFDIVEGTGRELVECPLLNQDGYYTIDFDAAEREMRDGVKAILFCNPHNPVGRIWGRDEIDRLAELCVKYGVYLLSDEAHGDFELFGNRYTSVSTFESLRTLGVSCISPNKSFNVAGIGTAFLIIPNEIIYKKVNDKFRALHITAPSIFGMVAAEAGYSKSDEWMDAVNTYIENNAKLVREFIGNNMPKIGVGVHEGTYLLWLDCSCFEKKSDTLARELAENYGIQLSDGLRFRGDGATHLRMNIAVPRQLLQQGLDTMLYAYRDYYQ